MTGISYCNEIVNVVIGCTHAGSPGCDNCWAKSLHDMRHKAYLAGKKLPEQYSVPFSIIQILRDRLSLPQHWRKPRRIFWCSTSDLFHERLALTTITEVFWAMKKAQDVRYCRGWSGSHTNIVLTKRIKRAKEYMDYIARQGDAHPNNIEAVIQRHVHFGVTCCNQAEYDRNMLILLDIPAAVKWVSFEPLLGPIDIRRGGANWYVIGCEQLPIRKAGRFRNGFVEAARDIVRQCKESNVPVFVKQVPIAGKVSHCPKDWPEDLRVQEYPKGESQ